MTIKFNLEKYMQGNINFCVNILTHILKIQSLENLVRKITLRSSATDINQ